MRTLALVEFLTVDGVMQGLGSPDEDTDGGFSHGGWGAPFAGAIGQVMDPAALGGTTGYLFGRRTYEKMAAFWPIQGDENPIAAHLNRTPKYVVSSTLSGSDWVGHDDPRRCRGRVRARDQGRRRGQYHRAG